MSRSRFGLIAALVLLGVGIGFVMTVSKTDDSSTGQVRGPRAAAPAGTGSGGAPSGSTGEPTELPATLPVAYASHIDVRDLPITTYDPDSGYHRWLRGEWETRRERILSEREEEALREAAANLPPDPTLPMGAGPGRAPAPGSGFESIDYTESGGSVPPDFALAAGADHIITVANVALEFLDKSGTTVFGPTTAGSFFSVLPQCSSGLYDPDVLYDEEHGRYIIGFDKGAFSTAGGYCVAVSATSDPTGSWYQYFFQVNTASDWLDYPHMGVGDSYVVFGGNMFTYSSMYNGSRMWALDKDDLYAGAAVTASQINVPGGLFTPQPLNLHGWSDGTWPDHGGDVYVLAGVYDGQNYGVLRWDVPGGSVTTVGTADLGAAGFPGSFPQNGSGLLQGNDWRSHGFEYRNGYGWTANTIGCNPGGGTVNCVRWAQIDLGTAALGPQGSGTISSSGDYRQFPAVVANRCDDMAIGYTISNPSIFPSVAVNGRLSTDPTGTVGSEVTVRSGEIEYTAYDGSPHRWGDYTGMAIDPDGVTFWYAGEYSKNTGTPNGRWGLFVVPMSFGTCTAAGEIFSDGFESGTTSAWD
jgi:hypothetical protein